MDWLVEARIREAESKGAFKGLRGEGKPLPHDPIDDLPQADRLQGLLARSTGGVPVEVELLKQIEALREQLDAMAPGPERDALLERGRAMCLRLSILFEQDGRPIWARRVLELLD